RIRLHPIDGIRTAAVGAKRSRLTGGRAMRAETRGEDPAAFVWTRVVPPRGRGGGGVDRAEWLTPYTAAAIAGDALHAGRGARLEMMVAPGASDSVIGRLRREFAWLGSRGVEVSVYRRAAGSGPG